MVIVEKDRVALVRLAQYVVHASFSAEKIRYVEKTGCVMYKAKLHQGKKRNFEIMNAIEFLHRVCLHIPGHYESLIRYYGYYANAARGKRKKLGLENQLSLKIIDDAPNGRICRKSWAKLIYQVYEVDPLKCPKCGAQIKIIAFILEREEIVRILKDLAMWPIEYPEIKAAEARASPLDFKLLEKFSISSHLK